MKVATLDLDLEVFQGPFDLLLTLVLQEEVDLLEVDLAEVVVSYVEYLEQKGALRGDPSGDTPRVDLEAATEFLVLIAALLLLKSQLMLPREEIEILELEPGEAADELLARMLEYSRYRSAAQFLHQRLATESGFRYRSAPLPKELRRVSLDVAAKSYEPVQLAQALGGLLRVPPPLDLAHIARPQVTVDMRLSHLREILSRSLRFSFDDAVKGADRVTEAMTIWALLELYKAGEAVWQQDENFGPIEVAAA